MRKSETRSHSTRSGSVQGQASATRGAESRAASGGSLPRYLRDAQAPESAPDVQAAPLRGTGANSAPLPHLPRIQSAFGAHDVSEVRANSDVAAGEDCRAFGARAYTRGNQVAFKGAADLRTAAHEAAHAVQQRHGAYPTDGMSVPGDAFERHADAVADAVVAGNTAEPLFDAFAIAHAGRAPVASIMRQAEPKPNPAEYRYVPMQKGGSWDAVTILEQVSQREYTQTRITKPQPAEGQESDPYRCGPNAVLASAIAAGPRTVQTLCENLLRRIVDTRERAKQDDDEYRTQRRAASREGRDPNTVQKKLPFYDVCVTAAKTVFDIHWNLGTGIRFGSEARGYTLTFADLDRLANYLYMFTFDAATEWRRDAEAAKSAGSLDALGPEQRARLEPLFERAKKEREEERKTNPDLPEMTWNLFRGRLVYRARFRTESEISDAAAMTGYADSKEQVRKKEVTEEWVLNFFLDRLKPDQSLIGMWGPHTYTFFRGQDKLIYLYDSWRNAVDEYATVPEYEAANSVHVQGSPEYQERVERGLSGDDKPIALLLGPAHDLSAMYGPDYSTIKHLPTPFR